ncbi:MAG: homocysteine biosynthesis protein [Candidatus Margulisbacteria bacterium]|nr:homocysteine biosynthesis protein [Candidatus Margulisiibacteriota bacterium]
MAKTIAEINEKIKKGQAVVVTAEEIIEIVERKGMEQAAREVDVVTTATFGPMCSSGAYFNFGHTKPKIKSGGGKAYLNGIPAYTGWAAVDLYIGATAVADDDPRNKIHPGEFAYGGAHVIEELVAGKDVRLQVEAYGTDCYPRRHLDSWVNIKDLNEAVLFNTRNVYQNYNVAVNLSNKTIYTYLGTLKPNLGNANYCSAGQLSPLLNDPFLKTIGIGTRIWLGGGIGYIAWQGTQFNPHAPRLANGVPKRPAQTLAVIGDLKQMSPKWIKGVSFVGYGTTLNVGIGVPIPVLNEEMIKYTAVKDEDILAAVVDYSDAYPQGKPDVLGEVNYTQLRSGEIEVKGKKVPTSGISSYKSALVIANDLKEQIKKGNFLLTEKVADLPTGEDAPKFKPFNERPVKEEK